MGTLTVLLLFAATFAYSEEIASPLLPPSAQTAAWRVLTEQISSTLTDPKAFRLAMDQLQRAEQIHGERKVADAAVKSATHNHAGSDEVAALKAKALQLYREEFALVFTGKKSARAIVNQIEDRLRNGDDSPEAREKLRVQKQTALEIAQTANAADESAVELLKSYPDLFGPGQKGLTDAVGAFRAHFESRKRFGDRIVASKFEADTGLSGGTFMARLLTTQFRADLAAGVAPFTKLGDEVERVKRVTEQAKAAVGLLKKVAGDWGGFSAGLGSQVDPKDVHQ